MFIVDPKRRVRWPVKVQVPIDGGEVQEQVFTAVFELLPQDEWDESFKANVDAPDRALLERVLVGWGDDVADSDKAPIAFSAAARDAVLSIPYARIALIRAWNDAQIGAKRKN